MEINFSHHFSITQPRYKRLSELKRSEAVYLPTGLLPDDLYKYINNVNCSFIPKDVLDSIQVVEFQKYDTMIDINGNEFDWSDAYDAYSPEGVKVNDVAIGSDFLFEKRVSAVNNMFLNDVIDIESSIIYNLLEIRPTSALISVDYLRYYFWDSTYCVFETNHQGLECENCEFNTGTTCLKMPSGVDTLNRARSITHDMIFQASGEERFSLLPEAFCDLQIEIDDPTQHSDLILKHKQYLDEQGRSFGTKQLQIIFGSPIYDELRELEARVYSILSPNEKEEKKDSYTGFIRHLEDALTIFNDIKNKSGETGTVNISQATIMAFKSSCEIILKVKLRILELPKWNAEFGFMQNIDFISKNKKSVFRRWLSSEEMRDFYDSLHFVRKMKNQGSHTTEFISINEAERIIDIACNRVIKGLIEYIK